MLSLLGVFFKLSYLMPVALLLLCSRSEPYLYYRFLYRFILLHCYLLLIRWLVVFYTISRIIFCWVASQYVNIFCFDVVLQNIILNTSGETNIYYYTIGTLLGSHQ